MKHFKIYVSSLIFKKKIIPKILTGLIKNFKPLNPLRVVTQKSLEKLVKMQMKFNKVGLKMKSMQKREKIRCQQAKRIFLTK